VVVVVVVVVVSLEEKGKKAIYVEPLVSQPVGCG
jgi:hypothetical protein